MSNIVSYENLEGYEFSTTIAASYGKGDNKSLEVIACIDGCIDFVVKSQRKVVLQTSNVHNAIRMYNDAI